MEVDSRTVSVIPVSFQYIIELDANGIHKAEIFRIWKKTFGNFFRVCPFCIHFCAILYNKEENPAPARFDWGGTVLLVWLTGRRIDLICPGPTG